MSPEAQRIAIAEACGIAVVPCTCKEDPWKDAATGKHLPDYLNDLNAMHEAVKFLDYDQAEQFESDLWGIICDFEQHQANPRPANFACMNAEAHHRAEAFLRTLNLWRDGQDLDEESNRSHLAHIITNCNILLDAKHHGTLHDDRPKKP